MEKGVHYQVDRPITLEPRPRPETPFRISEFDGAVQIWFEAEDFEERLPDDDSFFPVVSADGAFKDEAMTRVGGAACVGSPWT